jgi:hypothetical protein
VLMFAVAAPFRRPDELLLICHTRMAAPAQPVPENNGMEFKKRARPEILEEEKKDPEDYEPDFG